MNNVRIFIIKIWRITCANALAITGGISLMFFVDNTTYNMALLLTIASLAIFYYATYRDFGELEDPPQELFDIRVFFSRIWKITLTNALWIFAGLTYLLFVTGIHFFVLTLLTLAGFIMLYIDSYRNIAIEETSTEEADAGSEREYTSDTDEVHDS